jgi:hypothetical protein
MLLAVAAVSIAEEAKDPGKDGPHAAARMSAKVTDDKGAELEAVLFYPGAAAGEKAAPAEDGPFPVVVFSPGGPAPTCTGYDDFGKRFATWGAATLIVAFGDRPADKRAPQFAAARAWLEKKHAEDGWALKGKLDFKTVLAAGHSRGGAAAILAAADAKLWQGCLAVGPALRDVPPRYSTPTFLIGAEEDQTMPGLYGGMKKPRWMFVVEGMNHFLNPDECRASVIRYSTAWLGSRYLKVSDFKKWITGAERDAGVKTKVLKEAKAEE